MNKTEVLKEILKNIKINNDLPIALDIIKLGYMYVGILNEDGNIVNIPQKISADVKYINDKIVIHNKDQLIYRSTKSEILDRVIVITPTYKSFVLNIEPARIIPESFELIFYNNDIQLALSIE